jgi:hypothetical protein
MTTKSEPSQEIDEVERCRRARRALEQTHGDLGGLCNWIETLERQRMTKRPARSGGKPNRVPSQAGSKR